MTLIDEIKSSQKESHEKWFERWYKKTDLENAIRISAQQGYTGYRIQVSKQNDSYLRLRLGNQETISLLKEKLGDGFTITLREIRGENILGIKTYESFIQLLWG
ncbi:hypothetical protein [Lactococcus lactis]|uniref:hypothetical protein n=1 Tax=Lactococcus lactis TaxID=1358 RepID=UPI000349E7FE|nr:hypothetical protein [Lactococcus lactis]ATY88404.1 hypothetical protein CV702_09675 [Lactococcus lactis subsp. lactis]ATZ01980.1 hypothetical protein CV098_09400 [Lactococcus lactis subsp. lactis]KST95839.1 Phage protein [Lactococcus lactis subsp. lactis]MDU0396849.1 hypothetical protein [Lactococcus lactis]QOK49811.1 hypothetical protein HZ322_09355 [Lactococcus lactis]